MKLEGYPDEDGYYLYITHEGYSFDLNGIEGKSTIVNLSDVEFNILNQNHLIDDEGITSIPYENNIFNRVLTKYGTLDALGIINADIDEIRAEEERDRLEDLRNKKEREKLIKQDSDRELNKIKHGVSKGGRPKLPDVVKTRNNFFSYSASGTGLDYRTLAKGNKFTKHMKGRYLKNSDIIGYIIDDLGEGILEI